MCRGTRRYISSLKIPAVLIDMRSAGAPFRFLGTLVAIWVFSRTYLIWADRADTQPTPTQTSAAISLLPASAEASEQAPDLPLLALSVGVPPLLRPLRPLRPAGQKNATERTADRGEVLALTPFLAAPQPVMLLAPGIAEAPQTPPMSGQALAKAAPVSPDAAIWNRWTASAWLVSREGRGISAAPNAGQLGGGQYGGRVLYHLLPTERVGLSGRITGPLRGPGAEAAIGVEWQPLDIPVRLTAERRFSLDGGRDGTGLAVVGGVYATGAGFTIEGYGQAGVVFRDSSILYADGALTARRPIALAETRISAGLGIWGGAQADTARLDLGPSVSVQTRLGRVALDWRQRVAGKASPGSGPTLTLGTDF